MSEEEMITITKKEYDDLYESYTFLCCLKAAGVDNWDGYDYAHEIMDNADN
jgi:hypothetical protein